LPINFKRGKRKRAQIRRFKIAEKGNAKVPRKSTI